MIKPCIILMIVLIIVLVYWYPEKLKNNATEIELVISRYNEDLEWLKFRPFNKHKIIIYNKGVNSSFYKPPGSRVVNLSNVGRCDHTYLYHIIHNYDNLADNTIFLPGSVDMPSKKRKAKKQVNEVEKYNNTVFIGYRHKGKVEDELYDFELSSWAASHGKNKELNPENKLLLSPIRPFGKWYKSKFNHGVNHTSFWGILGINRKHIIQHPKSYYMELIKELETHSNPEVGHYFERSWNAVFYPLDGAKFMS